MKKLILADDSHTIQRLALLALSEKDIEMFSFCSGSDVIKYLDTIRPDMIVAGTDLEGRSGYEICDYIKHQSAMRHIPVLLLRSRFEPSDDSRAQAVGCDGILVKPFRSDELMNWVLFLMEKGPPSPEPTGTGPAGRAETEEAIVDMPREVPAGGKIKTPPDSALRVDKDDLMSFIDREELWNLALDRGHAKQPVKGPETGVETAVPPGGGHPAVHGKEARQIDAPFSEGLIDSISEKVAERVSDMIYENLNPAFLKKILKEIMVDVSEKD
jgi:CheY-like chemotaxis protein